MHQVDISNAYLNDKLYENVYMKQSQGFISKEYPNKVLKLQKAIYGLKQSGRVWNSTIDAVLNVKCKYEPCLYVRKDKQQFSCIAVYVDDLLIVCSSEIEISAIKMKIASKYQMHQCGAVRHFLGLEIQRQGK